MTLASILIILAPGQSAPARQTPAAQTFAVAAAALSRGDLAAAETGFRRVLELEPRNAGALGNLGVVYVRLERFDDAARAYQAALKVAPGDPGLLTNLALAYLKQQRYRDALGPLESLPPGRGRPELLAAARLNTGDAAGALAALAGAAPGPAVLALQGTAFLKLGRKAEAAAAFEQLAGVSPPARLAFLRGQAYYQAGLFEEAVKELAPMAATDPDARRELAKTYLSLRRDAEAERELRALPTDREARYYLGALLVERSRFAEGEPLLQQLKPGSWAAHYYLGKAALKQKRTRQAPELLNEAARLEPAEPSVHYQLMLAHRALGDPAAANRSAQALAKLRQNTRATQLLPDPE
ncbi:MAG: tetratricopeptide repeat protein [Acidobacteria bacterium]|nr:tetratricopeptide repeat protein [Acidobacteriota bacterium]